MGRVVLGGTDRSYAEGWLKGDVAAEKRAHCEHQ